MERNDFSLWSAELDAEEFSQALAVLGIILGENLDAAIYELSLNQIYPPRLINEISLRIEQNRPLKWTLKKILRHEPYTTILRSALVARQLALVWKGLIQNYGENIGQRDYFAEHPMINLEIFFSDKERFVNDPNIFWVLDDLSKPELRCASVYVAIYEETRDSVIVWDSPLRIGLFDDSLSRHLRSDLQDLKFRRRPLLGTHVRFIEITNTESDCDVLLLPHSLRKAATTLIAGPNALRCDCVIITGGIDESGTRRGPLMELIRTQARASGICLLPLPVSENRKSSLDARQIWFKEFIRQASHNYSIDVALFRASRFISVQTPKLFASPKLIEDSRISRRLEQFRRQISDEKLKKVKVNIPAKEIKRSVNTRQESYSLNDISNVLECPAKSFNWSHESDMATSFSHLKTAAEEALQNISPAPRKPRHIQVEIWDQAAGEITRRSLKGSAYLLPETTYFIDIYIGQKSSHSISADKEFSDEMLPPGKNEHTLTVFFIEPQISPQPQVATIVLPREGNSSWCEFSIRVPEKIAQISARIIIAYKNRVLQTTLLKAPVYAPEMENVASDEKIEVLVESIVSPSLQDLTERRWFDAAFIVNHNDSGVSHMTTLVEKDAELISIQGIADKIRWFDDAISEVAKKWEKFDGLKTDKSQDLLLNCALNGAALYKALIAGRNEGALAAAERVQIVTAKYGARLPLEFVYGRRAPAEIAKLCPNAEKSLIDGRCGETCPTGRDEKTVICPLGFWGLNRVIERHAFDAAAIKQMPNADFALQSDPVGGRKSLRVLTSAVLAASQNVDAVEEGSIQKVRDALDIATGKQSKSVSSWQEWLDDINARSPSLLVLLPHTLNDFASGQPTLEISEDARLIFGRIEEEYILGPSHNPPPVVILMGCKTASPDIAYENFILEFRSLGAALVVGTGSTILGRHAATVTSEFIKELAAVDSKNVPFGDVMLTVRRRMIAQGLLMALCLTSYGDTDWMI